MDEGFTIHVGKRPKDASGSGLQGKQAYELGKRWGKAMRAKHTGEDVANFVKRLGTPTNDHDRGALEGLTTNEP